MSKKIKSKVAAFLLFLQFIFSFVLPLQPFITLVQAQETSVPVFSKQQAIVSVNNLSASKYNYFFKTADNTIQAGEGQVVDGTLNLELKSQSGEDDVIFEIDRLVLKTDLNTYFLEIAENEVKVLKEYQADSLELNAEEENLLINSWQTNSATRMSTTSANVVLNQEYRFPLNEEVRVTFTKLPSESSPLSIQEIQLSAAQQKALGTTAIVAYDVTTAMKDGEFAFDLRLPSVSSENKDVSVKFAETISELATAKTAENELTVNDNGDVTVKNLDHMTIFVVVNPLPSGVVNGGGCLVSSISGVCYDNLQSAIDSASVGDTIDLLSNINIGQRININKSITIDGHNFTVYPTFIKTSSSNNSSFGISSSNITIKNLKIDGVGGTLLHGINIYMATGVLLDNVTASNNDSSGITVNGSIVTVNNIVTSGNGWGGINVDQGSGVTTEARLTINGASHHDEANHIWLDNITKNVSVQDSVGQYTYSDSGVVRVYKLDVASPTIPTIQQPSNNIFITSALLTKVDWSDSSDSNSVQYQYQAFSNAAYTANVYTSSWLSLSEIPTPGTPNGTYYVRVKAKDSAGNESAWSNGSSNPYKITVDNIGPAAPIIQQPSAETYFSSAPILNQWTIPTDVSGINHYRIEYKYDDNHIFSGAPYRETTTNSRNHSPALNEQGGVQFRVQAFDTLGNEGAWSGWRHYFYDATSPTVSINPLLINDKTPALNGAWTENTQLEKIEVIVGGQTKVATINPDHTWVLADNQLAALADGTYDVQVKATDKAGNVGNDSTTNELQIDSVAPTALYTHYLDGVIFGGTKAYVKNISQLKFSGTYSDVAPSSGLLKDSFVIFQAQNDGSFNFSQNGKLAYCGWRNSANTPTIVGGVLNDIAFADCKSDLAEGEYYLAHQVYDNAIRWDIPSITQFRDVLGLHFVVDQTKPTVTASVNPGSPDGLNGWYKTQPVITLNATDAALDRVEYHWNSDSWSTYSSPLTLANEGTHTLYYRAIDLAGNVSDEGSLTLKLDQTSPTAPTMEGFKDPTLACGAITNIKTVTVDWSNATDNLSLAGYDYEINYPTNLSGGRGTWNTFFTASQYRGSLNEGVHHVKVRAKDSAGNVSAWASACDITYDSIAPTLTSKTLFEGWYNSDQISDFNFSDTVSSVLSGSSVSCTIDTEGTAQTCSVTPNVCDEAGNCYTSELTSNGADIDKTKPTSEITSPSNGGSGSTFYTNDWNGLISGTANDILSGVDRVTLSIQRVDGQFWNGEGWSTGTEEDTRVTATGTVNWTYSLPNPTEDTYFIISHAIDNAGNVENSYELTIVFDKTIPEISLAIDPTLPDGKNGWYATRPTITLTMTDDKLTDYMQYQWESQSGAWTTYVNPIQPGSEGRHVLYYRAIDKAGNSSAIGIKNLAWDKTELTEGPLKVDATPDRSGGPEAKVTWEAATDNVGIDHYKVTFDLLNGDADFSEDVASHIRELKTNRLKESGTWKITVTAYDGAGHEKSASDEIVIDKTAPAAPTLNLTGTGAGSVNLAWNKVDEADEYIILYGVNDGEYTYAARVGNVLNYKVQGLTAGNYYFVVRAEDGSGNQSANSNQVSTLSLLAAPGGGNEVAEGFAETPEVLGVNTAEQPKSEAQAASNGEVKGANSSCNDLVNSLWWILLLAQFIGLFITEYKLGKKQKWLKFGLYVLLAAAPFALTHYFVSQACFSNVFTSWMVRYYFVPVLTTAMLAKVASYLLIEDES